VNSSTLGEAIKQQSTDIGWDQFLCGKLSNMWIEACYEESMGMQQWINKNNWAAGVVKAVLCYNQALWCFCCVLLHCCIKEESHKMKLSASRELVKSAYAAYKADPFLISQDLHHIFMIPLEQHLNHDLDGLHCFLSTYDIGRQEQAMIIKRDSEKAKRFFLPRSLSTVVHIAENSSISDYSSVPTKEEVIVTRRAKPEAMVDISDLDVTEMADSFSCEHSDSASLASRTDETGELTASQCACSGGRSSSGYSSGTDLSSIM